MLQFFDAEKIEERQLLLRGRRRARANARADHRRRRSGPLSQDVPRHLPVRGAALHLRVQRDAVPQREGEGSRVSAEAGVRRLRTHEDQDEEVPVGRRQQVLLPQPAQERLTRRLRR